MRISCHFELSTLLKTGLTDLSTSARYNPAFGRDDNGASFNHNWYYIIASHVCNSSFALLQKLNINRFFCQ